MIQDFYDEMYAKEDSPLNIKIPRHRTATTTTTHDGQFMDTYLASSSLLMTRLMYCDAEAFLRRDTALFRKK